MKGELELLVKNINSGENELKLLVKNTNSGEKRELEAILLSTSSKMP